MASNSFSPKMVMYVNDDEVNTANNNFFCMTPLAPKNRIEILVRKNKTTHTHTHTKKASNVLN